MPLALLLAALALPPPGQLTDMSRVSADTSGAPQAGVGHAGAHRSQAPDSSDLRKEARDAQRRFEHRRSRWASVTLSGSGGECDEIVGRMCMRFGDSGWRPKPEPERVVEERDRLLGVLDSVLAGIPGDPWVRGQLLWYLVEAERVQDAADVAGACPAAVGWWCPAFRGFVLHVEGRFPEAEAAFDTVLATLPDEDRERWTDIEDLLDREARGWLNDADDRGDAPDALVERFWTLSDPFLMVDGNERRTEHYARWVLAHLREDARNGYGVSWGDDLRELLVRYGWEIGWERTRPHVGRMEYSTIGHQHPDAVQFTPPGEVLPEPARVAPGEWTPEGRRPKTTYAPSYAPAVDTLSAVVARFPREAGVRIVVGMDPAWGDTLDGPREEGVYLGRLDDTPDRRPAVRRDAPGTWDVLVPSGEWMVSAEIIHAEAERAARARFGTHAELPLPGVPTLSDLLLLERVGPLPASLDAALDAAAPLRSTAPTARIRAVWEVGGLSSEPQTLAYSVELERLDGSFFRRAAQALRIVGADDEQLLSWTEASSGDERVFRAIDIDVPELDEGEYRLALTLRLEGRSDMRITQTFRVEDPEPR